MPARGADGQSAFLARLRADSNYPTFRSVVSVFAALGYVLAALVAIASLVALFKGGVFFIGGSLLGLAFALFIVVMTRMSKEMSLMVADGSDALVRMAERSERA